MTMLRRHGAILAVLLALTPWYLWLNWYDGLGSLQGDGLIYVSTARHYAPYLPPHPLDEIWASVTQFPPGYGALLAATGGAADFRLAHGITALSLVAAFAAFYAWLVLSLGVERLRAALGATLLALAPGTFMLSFHLYPEGMYLAMVFAALIALARGEQTAGAAWFWTASAATAAAILTRTVGIALLPALFVALARARPRGWPVMFALALGPGAVWSLVHNPPFNYTRSLKDRYLGTPVEDVVRTLWDATQSAAWGLLHNVNQNQELVWLAVPLVAVAGVVAFQRVFRWRPDAWYLLAYLGILAIWPYANEGPRLTWVVVPILLGYLVCAGQQAALRVQASSRWSSVAFRWAPVAALALMVVPEFALLSARAVHPLSLANPAYRHYPQWYEPSLKRAHALTEMHLGVAEAFRKFAHQIPANECFFSTLEDLGSFYMRVPAQEPPPESIDDAVFNEELHQAGCRYFVFSVASSHDGERDFYPLDRVRDRVRILDEYRMALEGRPVVSVLAVLRDEGS